MQSPGLAIRASLSSFQLCTVGLVEPARGTGIGWRAVFSIGCGGWTLECLVFGEKDLRSIFCLLYNIGHFAVLNCFSTPVVHLKIT